MTKNLLAAAAIPLLFLAGCSSTEPGATQTAVGTQTPQVSETAFLEPFGLDGGDPREIVAVLDQTNDDREKGIVGSVRYDHVVFTTEEGEQKVPLADDDFYLSLAPYVDQTHECYYHNLASCQGELVGEDMDVTITSADGEVLVDETVTTYDNGFVGFWLPRDIEGTVEVAFDGKSVVAPIATGPEDPTCVTTLQLT